ncbi:MAG: hypothetical protein AAGA75_18070 [Cyanobacteria bacterium P01_E01_bin.6]
MMFRLDKVGNKVLFLSLGAGLQLSTGLSRMAKGVIRASPFRVSQWAIAPVLYRPILHRCLNVYSFRNVSGEI